MRMNIFLKAEDHGTQIVLCVGPIGQVLILIFGFNNWLQSVNNVAVKNYAGP